MTKTSRHTILFLAGFCILSVIGIWHALPNTNVVGDESGYVGGVLRAMQAHTIVPHIYDAYTVSFLVNYAAMLPVVAIVLAWTHFSITHAEALLYAHFEWLYLVPRLVSVCAALGIAYTFLLLADLMGHARKIAYAAVALVLSTVILAVIMHTGKMWTLNGLLLLLADYFCVSACMAPPPPETRWWKSSIFWSIGCAFLGIANFPLNGIGLMVLPFLFERFRDKQIRWQMALYALVWAVIAGGLILLNLHGWIAQNDATPTGNAPSFLANIAYHFFLIAAMAPFVVAAIVAQVGGSLHKRLFFLALGECALYVVLLSVRAQWVAGHEDTLRYEFFVVLLLGCMLLATSLTRRKTIVALLAVSLIFYLQTLRLLAAPTTYNEARDWVVDSLAPKQVAVTNALVALNLPKTPTAYSLVFPSLCESHCAMAAQYGFDSSYQYLVLDKETDPARLAALNPRLSAHYDVGIVATTSPEYTLVRSFGDSGETYFSVGYRMGMYDPRFLLAKRLGPTIYLYQEKAPQ